MKPVFVAKLAQHEIKQAVEFHNDRKPGLGAEFVDRVAEALERIRKAPDGYQMIHSDVRRVTLRQFRDWALWFRILPETSVVVACLNSRSDPQTIRQRALKIVPGDVKSQN